jgi:hypothetical protein
MRKMKILVFTASLVLIIIGIVGFFSIKISLLVSLSSFFVGLISAIIVYINDEE